MVATKSPKTIPKTASVGNLGLHSPETLSIIEPGWVMFLDILNTQKRGGSILGICFEAAIIGKRLNNYFLPTSFDAFIIYRNESPL